MAQPPLVPEVGPQQPKNSISVDSVSQSFLFFLFVCLLILNSDSMILLLFLDLGQLY